MKENMSELFNLCSDVKNLICDHKTDYLDISKKKVKQAMADYPDACEPHNLMGIIKVIENDYVSAMKHFRAAYALDSTNLFVRKNIDVLCSFHGKTSQLLFGNEDINNQKESKYFVEFDERGIGHIKRKRGITHEFF